MTEQNPADPHDPLSPLDAAGGRAEPPPPRRKRSRALRRMLLFLVLLLLFLGFIGYVGYQQRALQSRLDAGLSRMEQIEQIEQTEQMNDEAEAEPARQPAALQQEDGTRAAVTALQQEVARLQQRIDLPRPMDEAAIRASERRLNGEVARLEGQLARLQRQQTAPEPDWKLREAELLLGIAGRRLQLEGDVAAAIALLEDADAALMASRLGSDSAGGALFEAREALAADLSGLRQLRQPDRDGLYLRLGQLLQELERINLLDSLRQDFMQGAAAADGAGLAGGARNGASRNGTRNGLRNGGGGEAEAVAGGWFASALDFLSSVFVWRSREADARAALQASLLPGQEALLRQRLRLLLEQARLAIYIRDAALYQNSLGAVAAELRRHSLTDAQAGRAAATELEQLMDIDIAPELPSLSRSTALVAELAARD